ncbi:MAG: hypothetical protein ABII12_16890 [Planctomycetota bacterium]
MRLKHSTSMDTGRLARMLSDAVAGWPHDGLDVTIRYSRSADFSGSCYYNDNQVRVNIGRHLEYPYRMETMIARPQSDRRHWWRELYSVELRDAYHVALFVFLHEFYHWLVKRARRNVRQKEGRCDRFATRVLVDRYGATVRDSRGKPVPRESWDFQDLDGFVAAAMRRRGKPRRRPSVSRGSPATPAISVPPDCGEQLLLFEF